MRMIGKSERGQGVVEYGLLLSFIVLTGFIGIQVLGVGVGTLWANNAARLVAALSP